jgi:protoporphyrin/coproporphyrin ferrochelatase
MTNSAKRGIILMNLGSPDSTQVRDVKKYLDEFLMDKRVIDSPYLIRAGLVKGIIVPFRAPKSAEAYKKIWTKEGSPLMVLTAELVDALKKAIPEPVEMAMRYGSPSPKQAYDKLMKEHPGIEEIVLVPLYPHYAMSSYETAVEYAKEQYNKGKYSFKLTFIKPYYNNPEYLDALAESMRPYLDQDYDHLLFSYHGIPERHIRKSDITGGHCLSSKECCNTPSPAHKYCYRHQVFDTTKQIVKRLNIPAGKYSNSFQSRLGKEWLQPYTDFRLKEMPAEGIKKLLVVCPAFVSDCLETLEEIAQEGKHTFMEAGGSSFTMIPCMNTHPAWVSALAKWLNEMKQGSREMVLD